MSLRGYECDTPLPDGSPCATCRVHEVLLEAEAMLDPESVKQGYSDVSRCLNALGNVIIYYLADLDHVEANHFVGRLYMASRNMRAQQYDALAHPQGQA